MRCRVAGPKKIVDAGRRLTVGFASVTLGRGRSPGVAGDSRRPSYFRAYTTQRTTLSSRSLMIFQPSLVLRQMSS